MSRRYRKLMVSRAKRTRRRRRLVLARDPWVCKGPCGRLLTREEITLDHIQPRSWGGSDDLENLQIMCQPCNHAKGSG